MSRLYLDACVIIYFVESVDPFHARVAERVRRHGEDGESDLATSRLSRLECRTRPRRNADTLLLDRYEEFFSARRLLLADVSNAIIERATDLRARYGFKTPDALHLATAIELRADIFLTGDQNLARCDDIVVEVLEATR